MIFEYTGAFYVSEEDLERMVAIHKKDHYTAEAALEMISDEWGEADYYTVPYVEDAIIAEIKRRANR